MMRHEDCGQARQDGGQVDVVKSPDIKAEEPHAAILLSPSRQQDGVDGEEGEENDKDEGDAAEAEEDAEEEEVSNKQPRGSRRAPSFLSAPMTRRATDFKIKPGLRLTRSAHPP